MKVDFIDSLAFFVGINIKKLFRLLLKTIFNFKSCHFMILKISV